MIEIMNLRTAQRLLNKNYLIQAGGDNYAEHKSSSG